MTIDIFGNKITLNELKAIQKARTKTKDDLQKLLSDMEKDGI